MEIWLVSILILAALILLVTEKIPVDLTAMGIMVVLMVTSILTPLEAISGFANPAVVTVGAMYIVGRGLVRTGVVGYVGRKVIEYSHGNGNRALLLIVLIVACASAFINNTPVVVLFIPIIFSLSCEYGFSPSKYLIPISYASILAGTCTLIGTSTNIIVSDLSASYGYGELGLFELSPLGVPIALGGILFLSLAARRILPGHAAPTCERQDREDRKYLAELQVVKESPLVGKTAREVFTDTYPRMDLLEIIRNYRIFYPDQQLLQLAAGDILFVKGQATDLVTVLNSGAVALPHPSETDLGRHDTVIVELIVSPDSSLRGETLADSDLQDDPDISILAVKRQGLHYAAKRLKHLVLKTGDIILIQCPEEKLAHIRREADAIIVEDVQSQIIYKNRAWRAILIFLGLVTAASTGMASIMESAVAAVFLMLLTGCLQVREAYRALQGNVLFLIVGTIALGTAMEKTGAAKVYADTFLSLFHGLGPRYVLAGLLIMTSIGTHVLSNNATAVLMLPVAVSTALSLGVDPKPFIVGVCFGASACYATPIGYQTNLMVYSPGGYRFRDYLWLGIPLNLFVLAMAALFIPTFWPF
jgi:di/tricarboxylate transporter